MAEKFDHVILHHIFFSNILLMHTPGISYLLLLLLWPNSWKNQLDQSQEVELAVVVADYKSSDFT